MTDDVQACTSAADQRKKWNAKQAEGGMSRKLRISFRSAERRERGKDNTRARITKSTLGKKKICQLTE